MNKVMGVAASLLLLVSCHNPKADDTTAENTAPPQEPALVTVPGFNADSAYSYAQAQVDFGPRTPNSAAHDKCAVWMAHKLKGWVDTVYVQKYTATAFDGLKMKSVNIIAAINPQATTRVFISSHWDTRPIADEDDHDRDKPINGADDGAGSTAVAMEIARTIHQQRPEIGVDIILFDSEDYGQPDDSKLPKAQNSWCLGSQYWASNPHVPGYRADFGINLDMVGTADASFPREGVSATMADWVSQYVWHTADRLGYSSLFVNRIFGQVTDDHYYVNQIIHIPTIDVIRYGEDGFGHHHHTHKDNMDLISKNTLGSVGKVMIQVIYQYNQEKSAKTKG